MKSFFDSFCIMLQRLPAKAIFRAVQIQGRSFQHDFTFERPVPVEDAISILNFCNFLEAVSQARTISSVVLPGHHVATYKKILEKLVVAQELPSTAMQHFETLFPETRLATVTA